MARAISRVLREVGPRFSGLTAQCRSPVAQECLDLRVTRSEQQQVQAEGRSLSARMAAAMPEMVGAAGRRSPLDAQAPAFETAATRPALVPTPMPPSTTGCSMPKSVHIFFSPPPPHSANGTSGVRSRLCGTLGRLRLSVAAYRWRPTVAS